MSAVTVTTGTVREIRTYSNALTAVAISRDGNLLLVGGTDARLFDL